MADADAYPWRGAASVPDAMSDPVFARPDPRTAPGDRLRALCQPALARVRSWMPGPRVSIGLALLGVVAAALFATAAMARRTDGVDAAGSRSGVGTGSAGLPATNGARPLDVLPLATNGPTIVASTVASLPGNTGSGNAAAPSGGGATTPTVVVHAAGAVRLPGVYRLQDPARVDDVVREAGGLAGDADVDAINLAARVGDGERVFVPRKGQVPPSVVVGSAAPSMAGAVSGASTAGTPSSAGGGMSTAVGGGVIDLNTATAEQLDALPGVGPAIAARIVEHRTRLGRFRSINQLLDVPGIGEAKLASMRSRIKV